MNWAGKITDLRDAFLRFPVPARVMLGSIIGTVVLFTLIVVFRLLFWWGSSGQISARLEPRIGQTLGFLEAEEQVAQSLAERNGILEQLAFKNTGDSGRGGALLQQEIRKLSAQHDLTVIGSEVQEPEALDDLLKLKVNVRVAGHPANVTRFFQSLSVYRPALFVSGLSINPQQRQLISARSRNREQYDNTLIVQLDVYAYQMGERG
jgi:hypothetical protein